MSPELRDKLKTNPTVSEYFGHTKETFAAAAFLDFGDHIKEGDVLIIEPNLAPKRGDIIVTKTERGSKIEIYEPPPPRLFLATTNGKRCQKKKAATTPDGIIGVIVAVTKKLR